MLSLFLADTASFKGPQLTTSPHTSLLGVSDETLPRAVKIICEKENTSVQKSQGQGQTVQTLLQRLNLKFFAFCLEDLEKSVD